MKSSYLAKIRQQNPLIYNMTNIVAANFTANGLLAIGASPLMSTTLEEAEDLVRISNALLINIGSATKSEVETMRIAGKMANQIGIPVVLDPVGIGATDHRYHSVMTLLNEIQFSVILGNLGEMAKLAQVNWQAKGVDAGNGSVNIAEIAHAVANRYQCVVVVSGEIDYISDGKRLVKIANGTKLFPRITASGCLLGSVFATFCAVASGQIFEAICEGATAYAIAGELAAKPLNTEKLGTFNCEFLNQLAMLSAEIIEHHARISYE
ncbi:hydroxyethylthiazole kinase [Actinobacillus vicugnae]|uniref:hydroxyethylthiazole kinase n=1 Tax=Actinobacillus vicugnae TaxID=2573093 RepID=UPI00124146F7|nr:hydroxyethylthiazole kinase [Actinobacillus vicugnae]